MSFSFLLSKDVHWVYRLRNCAYKLKRAISNILAGEPNILFLWLLVFTTFILFHLGKWFTYFKLIFLFLICTFFFSPKTTKMLFFCSELLCSVSEAGGKQPQVGFWSATFYFHRFVSKTPPNPQPQPTAFTGLINRNGSVFRTRAVRDKASRNVLPEGDGYNYTIKA